MEDTKLLNENKQGNIREEDEEKDVKVPVGFHHIFDKTFKRLLNLSSKAVINMINGLYGTDYPTDKKVEYISTEGIDDKYKETRADIMVKIDGKNIYHMEAQMYSDDEIVFRVFGYGYMNAVRNIDEYRMRFPESKIIYLCSDKEKVPEELNLVLDFGSQGEYTYKVGTYDFIRKSVTELNEKKMILLIPFSLLKLREKMKKHRDENTIEELKSILMNDILKSIEVNLNKGNIDVLDAYRLKECTIQLYRYLYSHYNEMESRGINSMVDGMLELEVDKIIDKYEKKIAEVTEEVTKEVTLKNMQKSILMLKKTGVSDIEIEKMMLENYEVDKDILHEMIMSKL